MVINLDANLSLVDLKLTFLSDHIDFSQQVWWQSGQVKFDSLYLFHDLLNCRSVWCVQQFSNEQRFYSSPHNARQRVGFQSLDQTFTEWSCMEEKTDQTGQVNMTNSTRKTLSWKVMLIVNSNCYTGSHSLIYQYTFPIISIQTRMSKASYWWCCHGSGLCLQCHFFLRRTWCHCLHTSWVMGCARRQPQGDRTWSLKKHENSPWAAQSDSLETEDGELRSYPQSWRETRTAERRKSKSLEFGGR